MKVQIIAGFILMSLTLGVYIDSPAQERGFIRDNFTATFYDRTDLLDSLFCRSYTRPINFYLECFGEAPPQPGCKLIAELADGFNWSVNWQGKLMVPVDGEYTFRLTNVDDGARLFLNGAEMMDQGWYWPADDKLPSPQTTSLESGEHDIRIDYEQRVPGVASLQVRWGGPNFEDEVIPIVGVPQFSTSLYMTNDILTEDMTGLNDEFLKYLGYVTANKGREASVLVILDFGDPAKMVNENNELEYGSNLVFTGPFISTAEISAATKDFIQGYWEGSNEFPCAHLTLAIGTNNAGIVFNPGADAQEHGKAWGNLLNDLHGWLITEGYNSRVTVAAASDIEKFGNREPGVPNEDRCRLQKPFGHCTVPAAVRQWLDAYLQATRDSKLHFYNYGSCENCESAYPLEPGVDDWYRDEYVYLSWSADPSRVYPIPEIYGPSNAHARQWRDLMKYALAQCGDDEACRNSIYVPGTLTQCRVINPFEEDLVCTNLNTNKPAEGWQQLYSVLLEDTMTAYAATLLSWSTDIINLRFYNPTVVSIDRPFDEVVTAGSFHLSQNYPNPFNPTTTIRYSIANTDYVILKVYNLLGQEIETLVNAQQLAGEHAIHWNPEGLTSGIYIYRLQIGANYESKKLVLLQ